MYVLYHNEFKPKSRTERRKSLNASKLNNTFPNNSWVEEAVSSNIKIYIKVKENENVTYQNLQETARAALREKLIELNTPTGKPEKTQINHLKFYFKTLEIEGENKHKARRKGIIKGQI